MTMKCIIFSLYILLYRAVLLPSLNVEQWFDFGVEPPPRPLTDVIELTDVALDASRCQMLQLQFNTQQHSALNYRTD